MVLFCGRQNLGFVQAAGPGPQPLIAKGHPVDWWFVFKFNSASFPACGEGISRQCLFGGNPQDYHFFGQQFVYASSESPGLQKGGDCVGDSADDPIGATFGQVYNGSFHFVIWNDQFYDDPLISGCSKSCSAPWGHSKGMAAWDDSGAGFVMQVTTPSWPASGNSQFPRATDGNTLGCVQDDNVEVSQDFFALKVTKDDLVKVLTALQNASVVTAPDKPQIVNNGGPEDIQKLVQSLGAKSSSETATKTTLSTGVELISKPSALNVPPWQMVSALLGGVSLRTATWWANPKIYTTTSSTSIGCWDPSLGNPGPVEIATTGQWDGREFGLGGGSGPNFNHAKIGVSTSGDTHFSIFGNMNQQGAVSGRCGSSQNGRGGLFYVIDNIVSEPDRPPERWLCADRSAIELRSPAAVETLDESMWRPIDFFLLDVF
jgi:Deoxyribonuclease II